MVVTELFGVAKCEAMRILHVFGIGKLPRDPEREAVGGLTRVALELARLQAAAGHRVVVASVARARWRTEWRGVVLQTLPRMHRLRLRLANRKLDLSTLLPLLLLAARWRFDVIHSHEYNQLRYIPAGVRLTHFHNDPCRYPADHETGDWEARECLAAARYSHAHVTVSSFVAERLRARYLAVAAALPVGFDVAGRIHVVHNGVDLQHFDPDRWSADRAQLRRSWGVSDEVPVFLYSGAIAADKGVLELARAFSKLAAVSATAHLVMAGDASLWDDHGASQPSNEDHSAYQRAVRGMLAELMAAGRATWMGPVPPARLPAVYAAADAVVVPSVVQEAFCLVAAEALAMGKVLVASGVGGLVEFAGRHNSILVPPADEEALCDAMSAVAADQLLRARLASAGRPSIGTFTWRRAAEQLDGLYADLLRRRKSIVCARPPVFYRI